MVVEHSLNFSNSPGWVQVLGASLGAVHNGVAFEDTEFIIHLFQSISLSFVSGIDDPSVSLLNDSWSEIKKKISKKFIFRQFFRII